jgi:ribonucleoside-diphosphate reductase alpha chain
VATHYILYRAERARARAESDEEIGIDELPHSITLTDGHRRLFNPAELHRRVSYAATGLDLCLNTAEIEKELLRSVGPEITAKDLKTTILLNAKTLLERDADFGKFAGRILLTYMYEETLKWDIMKDGVGKIKSAHIKGFTSYLKRGVKIGRLDPVLLERYDTNALSKLLDPSADLDFDYIGLQALYDRYLIIDKTGEEHVRIETPQFFWMRVAMGIFKEEGRPFADDLDGAVSPDVPAARHGHAVQLYTMYKSRRFCSSTPTLFNSGTPQFLSSQVRPAVL